MKIFIIESIKFFKVNFKKIILLALALTMVIAGALIYRNNQTLNDSELITDVDQEKKDEFAEVIEEVPWATFHFFIENDSTGAVFTNNVLMERYITLPEVLDEAALSTETNINEIIEETGNQVGSVNEEGQIIKFLGVSTDPSSHLHAFYVNVGKERENIKIARYYYDYIMGGNLSFLEGKTIYPFSEPHFIEEDDEENLEQDGSLIDIEQASTGNESFNIISILVSSLMLSFIGATGIIFLLSFFSKKLDVYIFYSIFDEEYFTLVDKHLDNAEKLEAILKYPKGLNKVVLQEAKTISLNDNFGEMLVNADKEQTLDIYHNFMNIKKPEDIERVVIIVEEGITNRKWYNYQREFSENYKIPTIIIQVNKY